MTMNQEILFEHSQDMTYKEKHSIHVCDVMSNFEKLKMERQMDLVVFIQTI